MSFLTIPARVDWSRLTRCADLFKLPRGGCRWVSFESIAACLRAGECEDLALPNVETSHHAGRIASLVRLIEAGVLVDLPELHVIPAGPVVHAPRRRLELWFHDGNHRFRAYEFLGMLGTLDVVLYGEAALLREALTIAGDAVEPHAAVVFDAGAR